MDSNLYPVCELTAKQEKAFNKLKKAYKECEKRESTSLTIMVI